MKKSKSFTLQLNFTSTFSWETVFSRSTFCIPPILSHSMLKTYIQGLRFNKTINCDGFIKDIIQ